MALDVAYANFSANCICNAVQAFWLLPELRPHLSFQPAKSLSHSFDGLGAANFGIADAAVDCGTCLFAFTSFDGCGFVAVDPVWRGHRWTGIDPRNARQPVTRCKPPICRAGR